MEPSTLLASGGIVGLFALSVGLVVWLLRIWIAQQRIGQTREEALLARIDRAEQDGAQVRREHRKCERQLNLLYATCNEHGITIPQTAWEEA